MEGLHCRKHPKMRAGENVAHAVHWTSLLDQGACRKNLGTDHPMNMTSYRRGGRSLRHRWEVRRRIPPHVLPNDGRPQPRGVPSRLATVFAATTALAALLTIQRADGSNPFGAHHCSRVGFQHPSQQRNRHYHHGHVHNRSAASTDIGCNVGSSSRVTAKHDAEFLGFRSGVAGGGGRRSRWFFFLPRRGGRGRGRPDGGGVDDADSSNITSSSQLPKPSTSATELHLQARGRRPNVPEGACTLASQSSRRVSAFHSPAATGGTAAAGTTTPGGVRSATATATTSGGATLKVASSSSSPSPKHRAQEEQQKRKQKQPQQLGYASIDEEEISSLHPPQHSPQSQQLLPPEPPATHHQHHQVQERIHVSHSPARPSEESVSESESSSSKKKKKQQTAILHTYHDPVHNLTLSGLSISLRKFHAWANHTLQERTAAIRRDREEKHEGRRGRASGSLPDGPGQACGEESRHDAPVLDATRRGFGATGGSIISIPTSAPPTDASNLTLNGSGAKTDVFGARATEAQCTTAAVAVAPRSSPLNECDGDDENYTHARAPHHPYLSDRVTSRTVRLDDEATRSELRRMWREGTLLSERTEPLAVYASDRAADGNHEGGKSGSDSKRPRRGGFRDLLSLYADRLAGIVSDEREDVGAFENEAATSQLRLSARTGQEGEELRQAKQAMEEAGVLEVGSCLDLVDWTRKEYGEPQTEELLAPNLLERPTEEQMSILQNFLNWFRHRFPYYYDRCDVCGKSARDRASERKPCDGETQNGGIDRDDDGKDDGDDSSAFLGYVFPNEEEQRGKASRTEVYHCPNCRSFTRFARYNSASWVVRTGRGRCGEYSMLLFRMLRAFGYKARWVVDWSDHVWAEVRLGERWVHLDPCEAAVDKPLLYQEWGKEQTYIMAFNAPRIHPYVTSNLSGKQVETLDEPRGPDGETVIVERNNHRGDDHRCAATSDSLPKTNHQHGGEQDDYLTPVNHDSHGIRTRDSRAPHTVALAGQTEQQPKLSLIEDVTSAYTSDTMETIQKRREESAEVVEKYLEDIELGLRNKLMQLSGLRTTTNGS